MVEPMGPKDVEQMLRTLLDRRDEHPDQVILLDKMKQ